MRTSCYRSWPCPIELRSATHNGDGERPIGWSRRRGSGICFSSLSPAAANGTNMRADEWQPPGSGPLAGPNVPQIGLHSAQYRVRMALRAQPCADISDAVTQHRISVERNVARRWPTGSLVVDDETRSGRDRSMALRYEGWNITTAGDGSRQISRRTRRQRPDGLARRDVARHGVV